MLKHIFSFRLSPITRRILIVNICALFFLGFGILYSGQYEREILASGLESLKAEARLTSNEIGEEGVREKIDGNKVLVDDLSRQAVRKLSIEDSFRLILFSKTGNILLDSHKLHGANDIVQMVPLAPPPESLPFSQHIHLLIIRMLDIIPTRLHPPRFPENVADNPQSYPGLIDALNGKEQAQIWRDQDGGLLLTVLVPVLDLKNVMGAALFLRSGEGIENAIRNIQITVISLFFWTLIFTLLLCAYLSETIARPIVRLAEAAGKVQISLMMKDTIPDLSYRKDEIGNLSKSFRDMTYALSDRIDAISRFAQDVAHEIKNPLASLKSAIETLPLVQDEKQKQHLLSVIHDDIQRMNRLINDISAASRLDSELSREKRTRLDLIDFLIHVIAAEISMYDAHGKIHLLLPPDTPLTVNANDTQLAQVLNNIIGNALSFLSEKGGVIVTAGRDRDKVFIHIDNDGPPIPESDLEKIFERFYSKRPKTEKFGLHSGLGLSISRQIIRSHQGSITASNIKDDNDNLLGVRFTILLPFVR